MPNAAKSVRRRRTPEAILRAKAQKLGGLALETLEEIMQSKAQDAVRLAAAREVLDRGHGRPKLGAPDAEPEGLTVVVRRFTDPPENEGEVAV
jgi:hypothetical protein